MFSIHYNKVLVFKFKFNVPRKLILKAVALMVILQHLCLYIQTKKWILMEAQTMHIVHIENTKVHIRLRFKPKWNSCS
jgi:hypothetical protein